MVQKPTPSNQKVHYLQINYFILSLECSYTFFGFPSCVIWSIFTNANCHFCNFICSFLTPPFFQYLEMVWPNDPPLDKWSIFNLVTWISMIKTFDLRIQASPITKMMTPSAVFFFQHLSLVQVQVSYQLWKMRFQKKRGLGSVLSLYEPCTWKELYKGRVEWAYTSSTFLMVFLVLKIIKMDLQN